jgi:hypothetical protein
MSSSPTDWKIWLPKAFWIDWSDPETWKKHSADPTIWFPRAYDSPEEKQNVSNLISATGDIIVGDQFRDIRNAKIINKAIVQNAFNRTVRGYSQEIENALHLISQFIEKSDDPAADALFHNFKQELNKPQPEKSKLKKIWDGIEKVLPSIGSQSDAVAKIGTLFS